MSKAPPALLQGTLGVLILQSLRDGPMHGYGVSSWVRARSNGALGIEEAALYQALHRMERKGWVASTWGLSENNRRARYYRLTPRGRRRLQTEAADWRRYARAVGKVLGGS